MPHYVVHRRRWVGWAFADRVPNYEYIFAALYASGSAAFIFGCAVLCYKEQGTAFLLGHDFRHVMSEVAFLYGCTIFLILTAGDFVEALYAKVPFLERAEKALYLVGSITFEVGTVYHIPYLADGL